MSVPVPGAVHRLVGPSHVPDQVALWPSIGGPALRPTWIALGWVLVVAGPSPFTGGVDAFMVLTAGRLGWVTERRLGRRRTTSSG